MIAETLKVLIKVKDVDTRMLGGGGNRQISEGKPMGAMRAPGCQLAHCCQNRTLHPAVDRNLAHALQRALDRSDPVGSSRIDHQLVAHRPAPADVAALDCAK